MLRSPRRARRRAADLDVGRQRRCSAPARRRSTAEWEKALLAALGATAVPDGADRGDDQPKVEIYDTTLRDGSQQVGLDLTVADKLRVAAALDGLGVDVIEGGWPGSNPKDAEFFERVKRAGLQARDAGRVRRHQAAAPDVEDDANLARAARGARRRS